MDSLTSFIKAVLKAVFSACIVNLIILTLLCYAIVSSCDNILTESEVKLKEGSTLYVDTSMQLSDIAIGGRSDVVVSDYAKMSLFELYKRITYAAQDPKVEAIFLCNSKAVYGFNLSQSLAVKKALATFKESGKKVYCYLGEPNISANEYLLASVADKIWINPYSILDFTGIAFQGVFLGNAFEKYGIEATVVKCGQNKSFGDMFTKDKFSPETKADLEEIAKSIESYRLNSFARSRDIDIAKINEIKDSNPLLDPKTALSANLVDEISYKNIVYKFISKFDNHQDLVNIKVYTPNYRINNEKSLDNIAIVYMTGNIVEFGVGNNVISANRYCKIIRKIKNDSSIKAVVFVINSSGGSAFASEQIRNSIESLAEEKKAIAYVTSMCASGAYWIATACDKIYAQETSLVGSVGVFSILFDIEKLSGDFGITYDSAKSGKYSDIFSSTKKATEAEIAIMQTQVDSIYDNFVNLIARSRNLNVDFVKNDIATGSVWISQKAKELGLIDSADNNLPVTLDALAKELNLAESDYSILTYPSPKTYEELFMELFTGESSALSSKIFLPKIIKDNSLDEVISTFDDSRSTYLRMPFMLK